MAGPIPTAGTAAPRTGAEAARDRGGYRPALSLLASLFFMWGFITVINNTLLPHLRSVFDLDYTQTTLIESVWFIAYFVASIPAAKLIERVGYQRALVAGLGIMALGTLGMILAAHRVSYAITLTALFVIASGITLLQVAANPYVAVVGPAESAPARLNLVQAFNSLGTTLAPLFGGYLILGRSASGNAAAGASLTPAERLADAQSVQLPYLIVAVILVVLAVVIARFPLPAIGGSGGSGGSGGAGGAAARAAKAERAGLSLWRHRNLVLGVPAIFIYLIAEIGVSNLFINFVSQPRDRRPDPRPGLALPVPALGRHDGRPLRRQLPDAAAPGRDRPGRRGDRRLRGDAGGDLRDRPPRPVGADLGRPVPRDHVPDDLHPGHPRPRPPHRGGGRTADHGDRGRVAGGGAGLGGGPVRAAALLPDHRRLRALRPVLRALGQPHRRRGAAPRRAPERPPEGEGTAMDPRIRILARSRRDRLGEGPVWVPERACCSGSISRRRP